MIGTLAEQLARARAEMYRAPTSSWSTRPRPAPGGPPSDVPTPDGSALSPTVRSRSGGGKLIAVGDSLGVGTTPYLKTAGSDTKVGRSSASAVDALKRLAPGAGTVLFDAGTNDASADQLRQSLQRALKIAKGSRFIVPTVNGPDAEAKNAVIRSFGQRGLIDVVDWAKASRGLVGTDGIHASPQGYKQRARLIQRAL